MVWNDSPRPENLAPLVDALMTGDQFKAADFFDRLPDPWKNILLEILKPGDWRGETLPGVYIVAHYCTWRASRDVSPAERERWEALHAQLRDDGMRPLATHLRAGRKDKRGRQPKQIPFVLAGLLRQAYDDARLELRALGRPTWQQVGALLGHHFDGWIPPRHLLEEISMALETGAAPDWEPLRKAMAEWAGISEREFRAQVSEKNV